MRFHLIINRFLRNVGFKKLLFTLCMKIGVLFGPVRQCTVGCVRIVDASLAIVKEFYEIQIY